MAEIILEPTAQSKVIPLSLRLNDTDTSLVSQFVTNRQFNTADTDAWFSFTLEGLAATTGTFDLTLINLQDKSVFNHTDKVFNTNPFYYKLDSGTDELTNEIRHAGKWVGQLVVTLANGDSATRKFIFGIEGHILDGTVVQTILLEDYNALITDIEVSKDELTQYNIDYASLIGTVTEQEAARSEAEELRVIADDLRETKEGVRQTTFEANEVIRDGVVDSAIEGEMISQTVATKLAEKEATFAPRMLSLESELAETEEQRINKTGENRKAYFTFIDDDAKSELFTKLKPVLDAHNLKITIAINPNFIGLAGYLTWAQVKQFYAEGHQIINHGWIGTSAKLMTLAEMQAAYVLEKAKFIEQEIGNGYDYYVYSGTQPVGDAALKNKIRQVYKCCYANYVSKQSYIPFDHYEIKRYPIQASGIKPYIDFCVENNAYCVLLSHSYVAEITAEYLDDLLTYIEAKGASVEYRQAIDMVDSYANQIENGNTGGDYFYLDQNGNTDFSIQGMSANEIVKNILSLNNRFSFPTVYFSDKLITDYVANSITVESVENAVALKLGLPEAGTVTTYRWYNPVVTTSLYFSYQEYVPFSRNESWMRKWNTTRNRWDMFTPVSKALVTTTTRPRFADQGVAIFDTTLLLPIWCKTKGYKANKTIARTTAFNKWDIVYTNFANYMCIQAGTTGASTPAWNNGSGTTTVDGTVIWEWVGADSVWINGAGTVV